MIHYFFFLKIQTISRESKPKDLGTFCHLVLKQGQGDVTIVMFHVVSSFVFTFYSQLKKQQNQQYKNKCCQ
jgi:hypothetical protein